MTQPHYCEVKPLVGDWAPQRLPHAPKVDKGRIDLKDATGPRVRCIKPIASGHEHLTLDQLRAVYSEDGKFRNC